MIKPIITFIENNVKEEAYYLTYLANRIANGFYQHHGYYLLPYQVDKEYYTLYFPRMELSTSFWKTIINHQFSNYHSISSVKIPQDILSYCEKQYLGLLCSKNHKSDIEKQWSSRENYFLQLYVNFLGGEETLARISNIQVFITPYGTPGSFYPINRKGKNYLYLTIRNDCGINDLIRTMMLAFYRIQSNFEVGDKEYGWQIRTEIIDYLLKNSTFKKLLIHESSNGKLEDIQTIIINSESYLSELGFPNIPPVNLNNKGQIVYKNKIVSYYFTKQETKVLELLIKNKQTLVTFDDIADRIWGETADTKFSLCALAKIIENIRKKIGILGVNKELIYTIRGKGYFFR